MMMMRLCSKEMKGMRTFYRVILMYCILVISYSQFDMDFDVFGSTVNTININLQTLAPTFVTPTTSLIMKFSVQIPPGDPLPENGGLAVALYAQRNATFPPTYPVSGPGTGYYENVLASLGVNWKSRHLLGVDDNSSMNTGLITTLNPTIPIYNDNLGQFYFEIFQVDNENRVAAGYYPPFEDAGPIIVQNFTWFGQYVYPLGNYYFGFSSENSRKHVYNLTWSTDQGKSWVTNTENREASRGSYSIETALNATYTLAIGQTEPTDNFLLKFDVSCSDRFYVAFFSTSAMSKGYRVSFQDSNTFLSRTGDLCAAGDEPPCWTTADQVSVERKNCNGETPYPYWISINNGSISVGSGKLHMSPAHTIISATFPSYLVAQFSFSNMMTPITVRNIRWSLDGGIKYSVWDDNVIEK